jgi:hypothetical protein
VLGASLGHGPDQVDNDGMATTMTYTAKLIDGPLEGKTIATGFLDSGDARPRLEFTAPAGSKRYLYVRASGAEVEYASEDGQGGHPTAVAYRYLETVFD